MKKLDEIELHTEEISNVLKRPPSFLVKSGTFLIFLFFVILIAFSLFIKYPETINCNLSISKGAQEYTIESFNNDGEIIYSDFPDKETHFTVDDTVLFIESNQKEKLYARITLSDNYEKEMKLRKELNIVVAKKSLDPELIHTKISSIYRPSDSEDFVINVELSDTDNSFLEEIIKSKEVTIPAEILLEEKTVFMRILSKIKELF